MIITNQSQEKYVVAYAKITMDKSTGIILQGVYFGGLGDTQEQAECIARDCVNMLRGGTILPKIEKIPTNGSVIDALYQATDKFERVTNQMIEADQIISRGARRH